MRSIERMTDFDVNLETLDLSLLVEPQTVDLMKWVSRFPEVVVDAQNSMEPCTVVQYCFELCHSFSKAYEVLYVKDREYPQAHARLAMYKSTRITLGNAIKMIGLRPLERM
jgi:arginyl-tRNA synthetase